MRSVAVAERERDPAQDTSRSLSEPRFLVGHWGHPCTSSGIVTSQRRAIGLAGERRGPSEHWPCGRPWGLR